MAEAVRFSMRTSPHRLAFEFSASLSKSCSGVAPRGLKFKNNLNFGPIF